MGEIGSTPLQDVTIGGGTDSSGYIPYDSPEYERDEQGNIKIYNPESGPGPEFTFSYKLNGVPSELLPLLTELMEIKGLLKQILNKL